MNQTISDYYKINVYFKFIDHVVEELETRFDNTHKGVIAAQCMVPVYFNEMTSEKIKDLVEYYGKFLTFIERDNLEAEMLRWKQQFIDMTKKEKPKTANQALLQCAARI